MSLRLDLAAIDEALLAVEREWPRIDVDLKARGMGKLPFTEEVRRNMVCAYTHLDHLVVERVDPISDIGMEQMLELNHRVHFGVDEDLRAEYAQAVVVATEKTWQRHGLISCRRYDDKGSVLYEPPVGPPPIRGTHKFNPRPRRRSSTGSPE